MNLFIASFAQVTSDRFRADSNTEMPYIGTVSAGSYHTSIINGTVFKQRNLVEGQLYLCQNVPAFNRETNERLVDQQGNKLFNVEIVAKVTPLELIQSMKELGAPKQLKSSTNGFTPEDNTLSNVLGEKVEQTEEI